MAVINILNGHEFEGSNTQKSELEKNNSLTINNIEERRRVISNIGMTESGWRNPYQDRDKSLIRHYSAEWNV